MSGPEEKVQAAPASSKKIRVLFLVTEKEEQYDDIKGEKEFVSSCMIAEALNFKADNMNYQLKQLGDNSIATTLNEDMKEDDVERQNIFLAMQKAANKILFPS